MRKEPHWLSIFRAFMWLSLALLGVFLYWSSLLVEKDLKRIQKEMHRIQESAAPSIAVKQEEVSTESVSESEEENLLKEDPFYTRMLPSLLPKGFFPRGVMRTATIGKPKDLHPFSGYYNESAWTRLCVDSLARNQFGIYESLAPNLAHRMEKKINLETGWPEYWIYLRKDIFWMPLNEELFQGKIKLNPWFLEKHPVTAYDVKFFYDAIMNPSNQQPGAIALRNYYLDIDAIEVVDDYTLRVQWKAEKRGKEWKIPYAAAYLTGSLQPLPCFVYQYFPNARKIVEDDQMPNAYRTSSVWGQNFMQHWAKNIIVSSGPWVFEGKTDREIRFRRYPNYPFPLFALSGEQTVQLKDSPDNILKDFKAGFLDYISLPPDQLLEWMQFMKTAEYKEQMQKGYGVKRLDYVFRAQNFIGWNMNTPYFNSQKARLAMTMGIDRKRIVEQILSGMGIETSSPFLESSFETDPNIKPWPYDPEKAKQLLEEEGWIDRGREGIREKMINGKWVPFDFTLTYYVKNQQTKAICEYVSTALKQIGVNCHPYGVDMADLSAAWDDKSFQALFLGWSLGTPPDDPRQLWHSSGAKQKGSSNAVGFVNEEADAIIEQLRFEDNKEERKKLYHRFHAIIHEEQPYTFLYNPKLILLYRENVRNVFIPAERQDLIPGADFLLHHLANERSLKMASIEYAVFHFPHLIFLK